MASKSTSRLANKTTAVVTAVGLLAVTTIGAYEGLRLYSYRDVIGVWTYCYGETKGAHAGMKFTKAQCDVLFVERLGEFETGMRKCLTAPDAIPDKSYVAFLSLAYNIGIGGFCKSSVARELNAGHLLKACQNLLRFNKAGGHVVSGLVTRRKSELKLCLQGAKEGVTVLPDPKVGTPAVIPALQVAPETPKPPKEVQVAPESVPAPTPKPNSSKSGVPAPNPEPYSYEWWKAKITW